MINAPTLLQVTIRIYFVYVDTWYRQACADIFEKAGDEKPTKNTINNKILKSSTKRHMMSDVI